jgi:septal ring factor EnvC (AmiA/AmiB activator)
MGVEAIKDYFQVQLNDTEGKYKEISSELQETKIKFDKLNKNKINLETDMYELKAALEYLRKKENDR